MSTVLILAFAVDALLGDPDWPFHPIRLIGFAIEKGEHWLRWRPLSPGQELIRGLGLVLAIVSTTYISAAFILHLAGAMSWWLGQAATTLLGSLCLARRSLKEHAYAVLAPLQTGNLELARMMLARIVSRETRGIAEAEVVRGTVESVAENSADGVITPLFYLALGGAPLALAYKAVNTLDSMLGYRTERYEYFGKTAARLDDVVNFIPARLTALALVGAAWIGQRFDYPFMANAAWRITWRDGSQHVSPNAGYPEAALAGALGVRLGGPSRYFGEVVEKPTLGDPRFPLSPSCIVFSLVLLDLASLLALGVFCLGRVLLW
jgi:adenosylcobinamide-phosphate synthase